jgi:short-subunit dehydrogenase
LTEFQARAGIPENYFPSMLARPVERVARESYRALMRGQRLVVAGSANKLIAFLPRLLPRSLVLKLVRSGTSERRK